MKIDVITLFPGMFAAISDYGVIGNAVKQGIVSISLHQLRDFTQDKYRNVDDKPYGGGPGMLLSLPPLAAAIDQVQSQSKITRKVIYLSPQGRRLDHAGARELAQQPAVLMIAGRYGGIDERVIDHYVDEQWSIGDYILSGGELAAMVVIDAVVRHLPGCLGAEGSLLQDSLVDGLLDSGQYTRPPNFAGMAVPEVLLSGDHEKIAYWRQQQALGRTWLTRPDLLAKLELSDEQKKMLIEFQQQHDAAGVKK